MERFTSLIGRAFTIPGDWLSMPQRYLLRNISRPTAINLKSSRDVGGAGTTATHDTWNGLAIELSADTAGES
jgi:hypothetical protein